MRKTINELVLKEINSEEELKDVLSMCWDILGNNNPEVYGYEAWHERYQNKEQPLVYAEKDGQIVSAVLGRAESKESLVIGYVACRKEYRRQGITRKLMNYFEQLAREKGFQYITLGSEEDAFYEKCGYHILFQVHGQNIYQKLLS